MGKHYTSDEKERALRLVREELQEYGSVTKACSAAGTCLGISADRCGRNAAQPLERDLADAYLMDQIWDLFHVRDERTGVWRASAESLYGRRKVIAWLRANGRPEVAHCAVSRALATMVRTWAGFVYVAFILDVFSRRIVAWHASMSKHADLVMIPPRMTLWQRERDGHPVVAGGLIHHSDAGSQYTSIRLSLFPFSGGKS